MVPLLLSVALVAPPRIDDVPVRVRLNHEQLEVGDRARVYIKTARDGFLVILHADPQGRVRVLFPVDPDADNFVRGGRELELRSRSDREALQIDAEGTGTVLAAFSVDAFQFDELTRNGHWDFLALGGPDEQVKNDPLAGLLEIVNNMARDHQFDYDVATYVVGSAAYASDYDYHGHGYGHTHVGIHFGFGYYPFGVGFAYGYPFCGAFCYDPFWYGGFAYGYPYYPYRGGYGYHTASFGGFNRKEPNLPRFEPTQPRVRPASMSGFGDRRDNMQNRGIQNRGVQPRRVEPRSVAPRGRAVAPRGTQSGGRPSVGPRFRAPSSGGRSISRPSGGGRSFGGSGGFRGGSSGRSMGGGRRH